MGTVTFISTFIKNYIFLYQYDLINLFISSSGYTNFIKLSNYYFLLCYFTNNNIAKTSTIMIKQNIFMTQSGNYSINKKNPNLKSQINTAV